MKILNKAGLERLMRETWYAIRNRGVTDTMDEKSVPTLARVRELTQGTPGDGGIAFVSKNGNVETMLFGPPELAAAMMETSSQDGRKVVSVLVFVVLPAAGTESTYARSLAQLLMLLSTRTRARVTMLTCVAQEQGFVADGRLIAISEAPFSEAN